MNQHRSYGDTATMIAKWEETLRACRDLLKEDHAGLTHWLQDAKKCRQHANNPLAREILANIEKAFQFRQRRL